MSKKEKSSAKKVEDMTNEEIQQNFFIHSYFFTSHGPVCKYGICQLTRFHAELPIKLAKEDFDDVDFTTIDDFETVATTICGCSTPHTFRLVCKNGVLSYFLLDDDKFMDNRKLRLPNFYG